MSDEAPAEVVAEAPVEAPAAEPVKVNCEKVLYKLQTKKALFSR